MPQSDFAVVFSKEKTLIDLEYRLNQTEVGIEWFKKIKHLRNVEFDPVHSKQEDNSDLDQAYENFCEAAKVEYTPIQSYDQENLNRLHRLYEDYHDKLSTNHHANALYKFHSAIHQREKSNPETCVVGWGVKEGPLTTQKNCNRFYEKKLLRNHIYLPWSELGKKPYHYWLDNEDHSVQRFLDLCKPHMTLRAKFKIMMYDAETPVFPTQFHNWFVEFKEKFLEKYGLENWTEIDEWCSPLLAIPTHTTNIATIYKDGYRPTSIRVT